MKSTSPSKSPIAPAEGQVRVKKLALIGAGKLGEGLLSGILGSQILPAARVTATAAHQPRADRIAEKYGVKAHTNNVEAVRGADLVLICLKPQQVRGVVHQVRSALSRSALIISRSERLDIRRVIPWKHSGRRGNAALPNADYPRRASCLASRMAEIMLEGLALPRPAMS